MLLTADVGNTHVGLVSWLDDAPALQVFRDPAQAAAAVAAALSSVTGGVSTRAAHQLVGIAVSEPRWKVFAAELSRLGLDCRRLSGLPLPVAAESLAATAGIDRLMVARAALPGPAVVVDAGTAVTVDVVDGEGVFQGGFIAPGPSAALAGLLRAAPALPELRCEPQPLRPGRETSSALGAGTWGLVVGGVDRLVEACLASLPAGPVRLLATGGWGAAWAGASRHAGRVQSDPLLVHRGMRAALPCRA